MGVAGALLDAAARGDAARLASILNADDRDVDVTDEIGRTALQRAAAEGHVQAVQLLLRHKADVNKQDHVYGNTAAHEAAWKGYSCTVALLARAGADLCILNAAGFASLHFACQNGHNQTCRELLLAGAPPDLHNTYGDTSLHTAARYGHAGVTRILLSAAARVADQNRNGDTALHIAAAMGRRKLTRILLEAGCDKALRNLQGETARDIATRKGLEEIVQILNTPVAKQPKKKRDKSKDRTIDEPDAAKKRDRSKEKKKKNVHFENPPQVQWSPYGCHYYPDPKLFPKPKLSSLPPEPLQKGEQYYLDLAGNIKKGPIGAGYTCYCAPFFKHMEDKLNEDKKDLKRHIDRAHEKLDRKVTDLEMKTQGQISELTRFVAAERAMCKERHQHLQHWITRGAVFRASERVKRLDYSPKGSLDIPPLKRTRSLEVLDTDEWNKVHRIIKTFNKNCEHYESEAKDLNESKNTSRSTELLDRRSPSPRRRHLAASRSADRLDAGPSRAGPSRAGPSHAGPSRVGPSRAEPGPSRPDSGRQSRAGRAADQADQAHHQNVTAEIHVKSNRVSVSQSPVSMEVHGFSQRHAPGLRSEVTSPVRSPDDEPPREPAPAWRSEVLQRTFDDIKRRGELDRETADTPARNTPKTLDISQDGYVKLRKHRPDEPGDREPRRSVQELVAQAERQRERTHSPDPPTSPPPAGPFLSQHRPRPADVTNPTSPPPQPPPSILKTPQQPQRPAPVLKEKPPKSKRFSLHNLIPFPTRKTFQTPPKNDGEDSESSDEEDAPIRSAAQPAPPPAAPLLQTLPLPNYEAVSGFPPDRRPMVPKDAYFHEIPNRQMPYRDPSLIPRPSDYDYNRPGLPPPQVQARNRNPLYPHQTGVFDAMMQDHMMREMERVPRVYNERPELLRSLQALAVSTVDSHSQGDRDSHNDSGYSTKVYGSSQGPSPSLSDSLSAQRVAGTLLPNGKPLGQIGTSSLV